MRPHLTSDEIERLFFSASSDGPAEGANQYEAREHWRSCAACQDVVRRLEVAEMQIQRLRTTGMRKAGPDCPPQEVWDSVAVGQTEPEAGKNCLAHASECGRCGPLLKQAVADATEALTPEEELVMAQLQSLRPGWQVRFARRIAATVSPDSGWSRLFHFPRLAYAGALAAVLAITGVVGYQRYNIDYLLANAYTQSRTLEPQLIPGAEYAPIRAERGSEISGMASPLTLLLAKPLIALCLHVDPNDLKCMQDKARADLLENHPESAIESLQRALQLSPDSPSLLTDLGTAYYQRAESAQRPIDYGIAIEYLSRALDKSPDDPVALYNRALAEGRVPLYREALKDWEHYLRFSPSKAWADDARRRVNEIREKLNSESLGWSQPLLQASEVAGATVRGSPKWTIINERIEDYLQRAETVWLAQAYAGQDANDQDREQSRAALRVLATITREDHADRWLEELLAGSENSRFATAATQLSRTIRARWAGSYDEAQEAARAAEALMISAGNQPGALRARSELVFALDRASRGSDCLRAGEPVAETVKASGFAWIEADLLNELATCRILVGKVGSPDRQFAAAAAVARRADYRTEMIRIGSTAVDADDARGDIWNCWIKTRSLLAQYWMGTYPPGRAFQLYSQLSYDTGDELPHTAVALQREAVAYFSAIDNRSTEAHARERLAGLELAAGDLDSATRESEVARSVYAQLPPSQVLAMLQADGAITMASARLQRGQSAQAIKLLSGIKSTLPTISNYIVPLGFYRTLGESYLKEGDYESAQRALRAAANLNETTALSEHADGDLATWAREAGEVYRDLVAIRFHRENRPIEALELWEWYHAVASGVSRDERPFPGSSGKPEPISFSGLDQGPPLRDTHLVSSALPLLTKTTILAYAELRDGVAIWEFDNRGIHWAFTSIKKSDLEREIHSFNNMCSDPASDKDKLRQHGRMLYTWLVAPVAQYLDPARVLLIEPDDVLSTLSFEALSDSDGTPLGVSFALAVSPGLGIADERDQTLSLADRSSAIVVAPSSLSADGSVLPLLPGRELETGPLRASLGAVTDLMGRNANRAAFLGQAPSAAIIHFAGHALSSDARSGLYLYPSSQDDSSEIPEAELLTPDAIRNLHLPKTELVVLAACSTGVLQTSRTAEPNSLVRAFIAAGAREVVASHWNVDSTATGALMQAFYAKLLSGNNVAQSLRQARMQLLGSQAFAHPYYWAAFSAFSGG